MTTKRFFLLIIFLLGIFLGWIARGANDGAVTETAVKVEVDKAVAVEKARSEKQIRDLELGKADLHDQLAEASAKDAIITRMKAEIEELKTRLDAAGKPPATTTSESKAVPLDLPTEKPAEPTPPKADAPPTEAPQP